jgi:outer membrane translocation and assembly module TamA
MGATHPFWLLRVEGRLGRALARKTTLHVEALLGLSGDELQVYDHFRMGGPALVPGYRFEELKGPQTLAAGLSVRHRFLGPVSLVVRAGAGNVFEQASEVGLNDLRWGVGGGLYYPSRVGPISVEVGVRDDGRHLVLLAVGWY